MNPGPRILVFLLALAGLSATAQQQTAPKQPMAEIESRHAAILGQPPRIAPLGPEALDPASQQAIGEIRAALGVTDDDSIPEYFRTMLRHPELMRRQVELSTQLFRGALSVEDRELAILRTAWLCRAPYEWGEHVHVARRLAGFTTEDLERIITGSSAAGWSEHQRAILQAVEELHADAMISDGTWAMLARRLDERQLLELPVLVGAYQGIAYLQNSVRFRLQPGNAGLTQR